MTNITKLVPSPSFSEFWETHSNQHPCSSIKAPRRRHRCKYVFSPSNSSFLFAQTCEPTWIVKAITSKKVIPVPPSVEHAYELLSTTGRSISSEWHKRCLVYLASVVNQPNKSTFNPTLKGIMFQCILILAQQTLRSLPLTLSRRITILRQWVNQHLNWCKTKSINMETMLPLSLTFLDNMLIPSACSKCKVEPIN